MCKFKACLVYVVFIYRVWFSRATTNRSAGSYDGFLLPLISQLITDEKVFYCIYHLFRFSV